MTKQDIVNKLKAEHKVFLDHIASLSDEEFMFSNNQKWTAGQQLDHIYVSVSAVAQGLSIPKLAIRIVFGKANRPSKSHDDLVKKYLIKLEAGGKASGRFIPKSVGLKQKEQLIRVLSEIVNKLALKVNTFSEQELDTLLLPHPLLGKITVREMLYFTIHHVGQHLEITKKNLQ